MDKLTQLHKRLHKNNKHIPVQHALVKLFEDPNNVDLQIDLLGVAHLHHWLPNQKRVTWESLDSFGTIAWIERCVSRIVKNQGRKFALFALLKCDVLLVANEIQKYSPQPVLLWDPKGGETSGIGMATYEDCVYENYFYLGWKQKAEEWNVIHMTFMERIETDSPPDHIRLDLNESVCQVTNFLYGELPYRHGEDPHREKVFYVPHFRTPLTDRMKKLIFSLSPGVH
ncbi:hypothetical protein JJB07_09745 [Tumebacillus sp. ITR2]|uniref:Uncharacterized protein n=1 Tax=Tumebacillus amylolyticus TaxID=2801339 RepID=A0ABS1J9J9_9BACL|nr:hypothetical protein [Tumebacillus amylolyticus]MBL0386936.1 hypothetical protein [Tumebacillus amylolyticus]